MLSKTHCLLALTVTSFALETAQPLVLCVAALSSQLPDVDTSSSLAGRVLLPLSRWLENRFPHRTITHSLFATACVAFLAFPLRWYEAKFWDAFVLGYFGGWFGDVFTKSGVAAFYPLTSARLVIPANPRLRLATGSRAEKVVCAVLLASFLLSLQLNTNGGLLRSFNGWLAQPEGVASLFTKASTTHQILAHIEGRSVSSATLVTDEFEVLEVEGERLLVRDGSGLRYWAGLGQACPHCHLDIHRVQARLGVPLVTETREIHWQEEEIGEVVHRQLSVVSRFSSSALQLTPAPRLGKATDIRPPTTDIRLNGELTLRDADSLHVPTSLQHFNPIEVVGNAEEWARYRTVRLHAATLGDLAPLHSYFGSGQLVVCIIHYQE